MSPIASSPNVENCVTYDASGEKCTKCYSRFYLKNNQCIEANVLCKTFDNTGACLTCYTGFTVKNKLCERIWSAMLFIIIDHKLTNIASHDHFDKVFMRSSFWRRSMVFRICSRVAAYSEVMLEHSDLSNCSLGAFMYDLLFYLGL